MLFKHVVIPTEDPITQLTYNDEEVYDIVLDTTVDEPINITCTVKGSFPDPASIDWNFSPEFYSQNVISNPDGVTFDLIVNAQFVVSRVQSPGVPLVCIGSNEFGEYPPSYVWLNVFGKY